jgi:N-methylhydantoinase A
LIDNNVDGLSRGSGGQQAEQSAESVEGSTTGDTYVLGIDIGGTFTDLVCMGGGRLVVKKTPSTPDHPGDDVIEGIRLLAADLGLPDEATLLSKTSLVLHGSTVATNILLTLSGEPVGLVTTEGFRDILEMRGGIRESTFDSHLGNAPPLSPRHLRREVTERIDRTGRVLEPLRRDEFAREINALQRDEAASLAICFKHAFTNAHNEQLAREWARELWPGVFLTISTDVSNRARLYDRVSTAVANSYVGPLTSRYVNALESRLKLLGLNGNLLVMGGNGGVMAPRSAAEQPVRLVLSGPSAGPRAAVFTLEEIGKPATAIVMDMGGTSLDVSVVEEGRVLTVSSRDVNRHRIATPMLDIQTVGAGGGSIAWLDEIGLLKVGPTSAGSLPGPACYGLGGVEPTVTDANLLLGYIRPDAVFGEVRGLSLEKAKEAIESRIAVPLGISPAEAALGIHQVSTAFMVAAVRETTIGKGLDPRDLPLVVAGGAGGLHGAEIADGLGIRDVVMPREGGVFCSLGMVVCDVVYDANLTLAKPVRELDPAVLQTELRKIKASLVRQLDDIGEHVLKTKITIECEARYSGQFHELRIPVEEEDLLSEVFSTITEPFHKAHQQAYGFHLESDEVEVVNLVISLTGTLDRSAMMRTDRKWELIPTGTCGITTENGTFTADRFEITGESNGEFDHAIGPAFIDLPTSTVFVPPRWSLQLLGTGDLQLVKDVPSSATPASQRDLRK